MYPDNRGCEGESLGHAVKQVTLRWIELNQTLRDTVDGLNKERNETFSLKTKLQSKMDEVRARNTTIHDLGLQLTTAEKAKDQNWVQFQRDRAVFDQQRTSLQHRVDKLANENASFQSMKELFENKLRQINRDAVTDSQSARESHQREVDALRKQLSNEAARMDALTKQNLDLGNRLYTVGYDRDQKTKDLKAEIALLKKTAEEERARLQRQLDEQKATLNKQHQVATKELRSVAEDLKQAFVAREHFKGLRDRDITGKFTRLATEVEDISTLEWNNHDTGNWPLSESQLFQIHPNNIRLLKQQIVQSSIWLLLYKYIMQSPFRIMGAEVQDADEPWLDIWDSGELPEYHECDR